MQGRVQEAIPHLTEVLRINPNLTEVHNNLGDAYLIIGNPGLALKEYEIPKMTNPAWQMTCKKRLSRLSIFTSGVYRQTNRQEENKKSAR